MTFLKLVCKLFSSLGPLCRIQMVLLKSKNVPHNFKKWRSRNHLLLLTCSKYIGISQSCCSHNPVNPFSKIGYRNVYVRNTVIVLTSRMDNIHNSNLYWLWLKMNKGPSWITLEINAAKHSLYYITSTYFSLHYFSFSNKLKQLLFLEPSMTDIFSYIHVQL